MRRISFLLLALVVAWGCNNVDDATPADLKSFIRMYEGTLGYTGVMAEPDADGGYIIAGNIERETVLKDIIIIKTNQLGNKVWETIIPNPSVSAIKVTEGGYLIVGDSIEHNPTAPSITEMENYYLYLAKMDGSGTIVDKVIKKNTNEDGFNIDYHGSAIYIDAAGKIICLGSYKSPLKDATKPYYEKSFVEAFTPSLQSEWIQNYTLQDRDYKNTKAIHYTLNNNFLWASTAYRSSTSLSTGYLSVLYTGSNTTFKNNDKFGENDDRNHIVADIQHGSAGYGVIGTYETTTGENGNIYFVRVDNTGNIIKDSQQYFDGITQLTPTERNSSESQDKAGAIAGTSDGGYVLAGSMQSISTGGNDIVLIKLNAFGNMEWSKVLGGSGQETISSIKETADGGLLICGTNIQNGLSTIFLMKTDENGELKN